jgi:dTDP-4-amino-4,6-dideoxygalactose transaminase
METFADVLRARRSVHKRYATELNTDYFTLQKNAENASLCFAAVLVARGKRDACLQALQEVGVDAKTYYAPSLHKQPFFEDVETYNSLQCTETVDAAILSLPIHDDMDKRHVELIITTLNNTVEP